MKKVICFLVLVLHLCALSSCSQIDDDIVQKNSVPQEVSVEYQDLMFSIDSLNTLYLNNASIASTRNFKQYVANWATEGIADNAGRIVGGFLGRHIGCVVGGALGSPVGAIGGYLLGRRLGAIGGAVLASYGASRWLSTRASYVNKSPVIIDYYLPENNVTETDSIGYYHNLLMAELSKNQDKYVTKSGELDYELMYIDCLNVLKSEGVINDEEMNDNELKNEIIEYAKETVALSNDCQNGNISQDEYRSKLVDGMKVRGVSDDDIKIFNDFTPKLINTTNLLPIDLKKQYAEDVNTAIDNSLLAPTLKKEMRSTTNMLVNSSICSETLR